MGFLDRDKDYQSQAQATIQAEIQSSSLPNPMANGQHNLKVRYTVSLPHLTNPQESRLTCHETAEETTYVSTHISSRIHSLFSQLKLTAANSSTLGAHGNEGLALSIEVATQTFDSYLDCDHRSYGGVCGLYDVRPLSLLVPLQCIAALPKLTTLVLPWGWELPMTYPSPSTPVREHYTRPWEGPLRDTRHEFGNAICEQEKLLSGRRIPASLKNAMLHFWKKQQIPLEDQSVARPDLIHPAERDPFSVGLCRLAMQLERLDLCAMVTEELFPATREAENQQWSSMQRLRIEFHPLRSDGMWYFVGPRGEDPLHSEISEDDREGGFHISETKDYPRERDIPADQEIDEEFDEYPNGDSELDELTDMFRTEPHRERIEPLLERFAAAVACMPRLKDAEMFAYVWWAPSESRGEEYACDAPYEQDSVHKWGVRYLAGRDSDGEATTPVVQWEIGDWRPSTGVMELFEKLGSQEFLAFEFTEGRPWPTTDDAMRARLF
ncbi:hypothetical protein HYFRA_00000692 [Hymenoscyphus fraxineus]|uniref:Uncharacterized protein n=1 Tax=Hymenoscyphus fraxineus TaxID=746836 RepID=A0A9N9L5X8_9HELO|nr:hypothetical protein HYFRA_00000692 [Hymenoscyphus fraxineus]